MGTSETVIRFGAIAIVAASGLAPVGIAPAGAATDYAQVTEYAPFSAEDNHIDAWCEDGVKDDNPGGKTFELQPGTYDRVIVKAGTGEFANTVFAEPPTAGQTVWADTDGNGEFGGKDKDISHIIFCPGDTATQVDLLKPQVVRVVNGVRRVEQVDPGPEEVHRWIAEAVRVTEQVHRVVAVVNGHLVIGVPKYDAQLAGAVSVLIPLQLSLLKPEVAHLAEAVHHVQQVPRPAPQQVQRLIAQAVWLTDLVHQLGGVVHKPRQAEAVSKLEAHLAPTSVLIPLQLDLLRPEVVKIAKAVRHVQQVPRPTPQRVDRLIVQGVWLTDLVHQLGGVVHKPRQAEAVSKLAAHLAPTSVLIPLQLSLLKPEVAHFAEAVHKVVQVERPTLGQVNHIVTQQVNVATQVRHVYAYAETPAQVSTAQALRADVREVTHSLKRYLRTVGK